MRLEKPEGGAGKFSLAMSPQEWKDIHALALFAWNGLAYDCEAPYVTQVFEYHLSDPENLHSDENMQAAFSAIAGTTETMTADGRDRGDVILSLPKEQMRQLLIILNIAGMAEEQADRLYNAARESFPYRFPDSSVPCRDYANACDDFLTALHHDNSLVIDLKPALDAAPRLDGSTLPPELRTHLETAMRNLSMQNREIYADDTRTIGIQTGELIDKIKRHRQHKAATSSGESLGVPSDRPANPFDYDQLKESVEKRGGTISAALTADQLRSQLSPAEWSGITNIDPELIRAEGERQRRAFTPAIRRYVLETRLAEALLSDDRIESYLRRQ